MKGQRGSFLGFTYNNIHSSILGITRTIDGGRFEEKLTPQTKDKSADRSLSDGQFFYGSTYNKREFIVKFAFDGMSENQFAFLNAKWNDKKIHPLIFDENPYKVYYAKVTGTATLKHLCFTDEKGERVYKGEGSLAFSCYFPYGLSRYEYLEDYSVKNIHEWVKNEEDHVLYADAGLIAADDKFIPSEDSPYVNKNEWASASNIPSKVQYGNIIHDGQGSYTVKVFNAGDVSVPLQIWIPAYMGENSSFRITIGNEVMSVQNLKRIDPDTYYVYDSDTETIQGYFSNEKPSGRLYNFNIKSGKFAKLPVGETIIKIEAIAYAGVLQPKVKFHYWYL